MKPREGIKKLYRSDTDKVIAGICGGLGEFWGIDSVLLRLVWLVVTVFTGVVPGIIVYILAIFIIPLGVQKSGPKQPHI